MQAASLEAQIAMINKEVMPRGCFSKRHAVGIILEKFSGLCETGHQTKSQRSHLALESVNL